MKQTVNHALRAREVEKHRTAVLRLELDYELATLYDAMEKNDDSEKSKCLLKLDRIRNELLRLKAL